MAATPDFDALTLTGRSTAHVRPVPGCSVLLHVDVVEPFLALREAAAAAGFDLQPVSAFRDFDRQLAIWNAKCRGERELLDRQGRRIDAAALDDAARVDAILLWSALPGASRHHWGTDLDVVDAAALAPGQRPRLVPEEYAAGGPFHRLGEWLSERLADFGFFRPYGVDRGGVQPEPWHLSHAGVAGRALSAFSEDMLREALLAAAIDARETVLARLPELFGRYVRNVDPPPVAALAQAAATPPTRPS